MEEIKKYHLYKDDYSRLHFQMNDAATYCEQNTQHCFKPHLHSFYQFIWFQTPGQHYVDYEVIDHDANTLFFIDKNQVHNFCEHSPNEGVLFHFDEVFLLQEDKTIDSWLDKVFNGIGKPYIQLPTIEVDMFNNITKMLAAEMELKEYNHAKQAFHLFQLIALALERLIYARMDIATTGNKDYALAIAFKKSIQDNIHTFLSIDQFSDTLGISSKKLTAVCKKHLDDTPLTLIHKRKILEAKRLLSNTRLSIKELAYKLGFDQPTYFTKYFKKHTGLTPKEFMKEAL